MLAVFLVLLLGVGVAACGSDSESGDEASGTTAASGSETNSLEDTTWTLMNIGSAEGWATSVPNDADPPTFRIEDGKAVVFAGCNSGNATAEVSAKTIKLGPLGMTMMACDDVNGQIEALVTQVLQGKVGYELNADGNLVLTRGGNMLVYTAD